MYFVIISFGALAYSALLHINAAIIVVGIVFKLEHRSVYSCFIHTLRDGVEKNRGTLSHAGDGGWHCVMPVSIWRQHTEATVCVCVFVSVGGGKRYERRTGIIPIYEKGSKVET